MRKYFKIAAAVLALTGFSSLAQAAPPNPELKAQFIKNLDAVLPAWGAEVLRAPAGVDWTGNLNTLGVARNFGPAKLAELASGAPPETEGVKDPSGFVRVDKPRGFVRMVNNLLVPRIGATPLPLPTDQEATDIGLKVMSQLGIPDTEFGKPNVATQVAADGSVKSLKPDRITPILKMFTMNRQINKLPVFGSNFVIAITPKGEIQRLKSQWPVFRLDPPAGLLSRADVLDRAGDVMIDQNMRPTSLFKAQIGYAPADNTVGSGYIPVALISAIDGTDPVLFSVPLVAPNPGDDR